MAGQVKEGKGRWHKGEGQKEERNRHTSRRYRFKEWVSGAGGRCINVESAKPVDGYTERRRGEGA